jgi:RNA methyltransferase, RsmD family
MRVIAGKYKSRKLKTVVSNTTRPTTDRNKESIFNMIGPYFDSGVVLDLFGGSGGLGIEAISRGCSYLYTIENQYEAYKVIKENLASLQIENATVWKSDYKKALARLAKEGVCFDLVLLDPPYGKQMIDDILLYLVANKMLHNNSTIVIEELNKVSFTVPRELQQIKRSSYGITAVTIYKYHEEE